MKNLFYWIPLALWGAMYCIAIVLCNVITAVPQLVGLLVGFVLFKCDSRNKSEDKDLLRWALLAYLLYWSLKIAYYGGGFVMWYLLDIATFTKPGTLAKEWRELIPAVVDKMM